ncbi:MAG: MauE/DoxX family redox-associated membrane protein [candidate division Zixibacteria bacterium]|nr:MauE/DoxX family redox-associated membrane protein [candidate division Zixibacteria bacterium]
MRRIIDNDILTLLIRLIVGIIFIYASYYKIIDPQSFAKSIWFYHLVPGKLINIIAIILPWIELTAGIGLILGVYYKGSVALVNILTLFFIIALSMAIIRGISIDCGCFKAAAATSESAWETLKFDFGLVILTIFLVISRSKRWMLSQP